MSPRLWAGIRSAGTTSQRFGGPAVTLRGIVGQPAGVAGQQVVTVEAAESGLGDQMGRQQLVDLGNRLAGVAAEQRGDLITVGPGLAGQLPERAPGILRQ